MLSENIQLLYNKHAIFSIKTEKHILHTHARTHNFEVNPYKYIKIIIIHIMMHIVIKIGTV